MINIVHVRLKILIPGRGKNILVNRRTIISNSPAMISNLERIEWLDIFRFICCLQIVGFHWLRACFSLRLVGDDWRANLVWPYRHFDPGLDRFSTLIIDQSSNPAWIRGLNNAVGLAFGFGWEAVSVFILVSGLSLGMTAQATTGFAAAGAWLWHRLSLLLIPFYAVAIPSIVFAGCATFVLSDADGAMATLRVKIGTMLGEPVPIALLKNVAMLDPRERHGVVAFFSPAWWFIPAIAVAYATYPALRMAIVRLGWPLALASSYLVSVAAYRLSVSGVLMENAWYFVVLHELFSFVIGIFVGSSLCSRDGRERIVTILSGVMAPLVGIAFLVVGNLLNWFITTYPFSSPLIAIGLSLLIGAVSVRLARVRRVVAVFRAIDTYHLYLLHQMLAFPCAAIMSLALAGATTGLGAIVYLALCCVVTLVFRFVLSTVRYTRKANRSHVPASG